MSDHVRLGIAAPSGDLPGVSFRQARYFRWGRRGFRVLFAVLHVGELSETDGAAEGLQAYASSMPDGRVASWAFACDRNSTTQSVLEKDTAFHAPPINDCSVGVELAGRSAQLASGWDDAYSKQMLDEQAAPLFAGILKRHGLPCVRVTDPDRLRHMLEWATKLAGRAQAKLSLPADEAEWLKLKSLGGIVDHATISKVFKKSTHSDPGPNFPWDSFLSKVEAELALLG